MTIPKTSLATTPRVIDAEFVDPETKKSTFDFEVAMRTFKERKAANEGKQVRNSDLPAGSSMYYYCKHCGVHTETLAEGHWSRPKTACDPCTILHNHGLI